MNLRTFLCVLTLGAATLGFSKNAQAWIGGPRSNDAYEGGTNGTYRAVILGENTMGVLVLVSSDVSGRQGYGFVFHYGSMGAVMTEGLVDQAARTMYGMFVSLTSVFAGDYIISPTGIVVNGYFVAHITNTGANYRFEGDGVLVSELSGTVPTYETVRGGFIVTELGDPIPTETEIWVTGTKTSPATTSFQPQP